MSIPGDMITPRKTNDLQSIKTCTHTCTLAHVNVCLHTGFCARVSVHIHAYVYKPDPSLS